MLITLLTLVNVKRKSSYPYSGRVTTGKIDLRYFDVTGFFLEPYIPYAWQGVRETLQVLSSQSSRLNVLGFLNRENALYPSKNQKMHREKKNNTKNSTDHRSK